MLWLVLGLGIALALLMWANDAKENSLENRDAQRSYLMHRIEVQDRQEDYRGR